MTSRLPWRRALLEGFVIVSSILLAFAIDAGWDGWKESHHETEYLFALQDEMAANRMRVDSVLRTHDRRIAAFDRFLEATPRELGAVSEDSSRTWIPDLLFSWSISLVRSVVDSEDSGLVRDPHTRRAIAAWISAANDVEEDFPMMADAAFRAIRHAIDVSPDILEGPSFSLDGSSTAALVALRDDPDYVREGKVLQLLHGINRRKLADLSVRTDSLLDALGEGPPASEYLRSDEAAADSRQSEGD